MVIHVDGSIRAADNVKSYPLVTFVKVGMQIAITIVEEAIVIAEAKAVELAAVVASNLVGTTGVEDNLMGRRIAPLDNPNALVGEIRLTSPINHIS